MTEIDPKHACPDCGRTYRSLLAMRWCDCTEERAAWHRETSGA